MLRNNSVNRNQGMQRNSNLKTSWNMKRSAQIAEGVFNANANATTGNFFNARNFSLQDNNYQNDTHNLMEKRNSTLVPNRMNATMMNFGSKDKTLNPYGDHGSDHRTQTRTRVDDQVSMEHADISLRNH